MDRTLKAWVQEYGDVNRHSPLISAMLKWLCGKCLELDSLARRPTFETQSDLGMERSYGRLCMALMRSLSAWGF